MAREIPLKYGCNPNQIPARIFSENGELPVEVLNGRPGYINFLDALNGYQLVKELKEATGLAAAASFKHVSPAGAAVACEIDEKTKKACFADDLELSPLASAYVRARGADRMSSYGDFIALSDKCDLSAARAIAREFSDGIIAPGYDDDALEVLRAKRKGGYNIISIDESYEPAPVERKQVYGITFEQARNNVKINDAALGEPVTKCKDLPREARLDLITALTALKYTQSNSVCFAKNGMAIGIGSGQQSRIHCTRLAASKADNWWLRQSPKVLALEFAEGLKRADRDNAIDAYIGEEYEDILADGAWEKYFKYRPEAFTRGEKEEYLSGITGVSLASDAFFPFGDSIERARKSGVSYVAQPGGSIRDSDVIETCDRFGITMVFNGIRLFHH